MDIKKEYERWLAKATADADVAAELKTLNGAKIEDAFYRDLAFGTGGLRGVIGAGTNRMNIYTVAKASQGLADYLKKNYSEPSVAIGYDSRIKSDEFDGSAGFAKMQRIMQAFRGGIKEFGGKKVVKLLDYAPGLDGLPKSDVLKFLLEDNCSVVVRPSGTEPKLKTYISISAENKETAEKIEAEICKSAEEYLK